MSEEQKNQQTPQDGEGVEDAETIIEDAQGVVEESDTSHEQGAAKPMIDDADDATDAFAATDTETDADKAGDGEIIEALRAELAATQVKADEYLDRLQRTAADFQNSRRRMENQLTEEVERANAALIMRLLPVLDDLDLAFQNVPEELRAKAETNGGQAAWVEGFAQIRKKLLDMLSEQGLKPIASDGEFDPHKHEAISSEPSETVASGHIIEVMRAGYEYKGRILRPALVRVAM